MEFQIVLKTEAEKLINKMFSQKLFFCNYFGNDLVDVDFYMNADVLVIRKEFESYYRAYILSVTEEAFCSVLKELPDNHVVSIPSKRDISDIHVCFECCGFVRLATYKRYVNRKVKKRGNFEENYALIEDLDAIETLLYSNFSPIMGYLPDRTGLEYMIASRQILVNRNRDTGKVSGVIAFSMEHAKCYLPFWVDKEGAGLSLLFDVFNMMVEQNVKSMFFWVNETNVETIKIHELLGATPDGLMDYIYIKQ